MSRSYINNDWNLLERPITDTKDMHDTVEGTKDGWMSCNIPCDVSMPLIAAGRLSEPTVADNCYKNEWIEDRSWWFKKTFDTKVIPDWKEADCVELVFSSLDLIADIFLNGNWIGSHRSCHYEFRQNVRKYIIEGENTIIVRLTVGLETVRYEDLAEVNGAICTEEPRRKDRGDKRRGFLRKPQYVFGWDWSPRIATCGIVDYVYLEVIKTAVIRNVHIYTKTASVKTARIAGELEIEDLSPLSTIDAEKIRIDISYKGKRVAFTEISDQLLCSGLNYIPFYIHITDPILWWPNGMGGHDLYDVDIFMVCNNETISYPKSKLGIRTIELDQHRIDDERRHFAFIVNGIEIFSKGGDWVPSDPIYARVDDQRLDKIIKEAEKANLNTFRIWGGAVYNREKFYELCDESGILIWQDFMFACSAYPDHLDWFTDLCEKEIDYQTKRLRNHACMALFCGNNECHEIFSYENFGGWGVKLSNEKQFGLKISNNTARKYVHDNCPEIPYWNSSPYGGATPQSASVGDVHYWNSAMMSPVMENRITPEIYDEVTSGFVSEYGYIGPTCLETIKDYHGDADIVKGSVIWDLHNNTMEKDTADAGVKKHYSVEDLSLPEYVLYAGMVQGILLGYSLEAFRYKTYCCGGIFWMFNDCWGEVGWTVLDYYLRRKIAFYAVKRAFEPVIIILRKENGKIKAVGVNETDKDIECICETGWISYDSTMRETRNVKLNIPRRSRSVVYECAMHKHDPAYGCFAMIPDMDVMNASVLRENDICEKRLCGHVSVVRYCDKGNDLVITVRAETFVHGVYFSEDHKYSDNYFDMLPGATKDITAYGAKGKRPVPKQVIK